MNPSRPIDPAYEDLDRYQSRRTFLVAVHIFLALCYFAWRVTVFNQAAPVFSLVFYLTELGGFAGTILLFSMLLKRRKRTPHSPQQGQSVDVFITTLNEDRDIVRRTVLASLRMRYPHETWLLDDGDRRDFRQMAEELGCHYLARKQHTGAKAGNLNHALKFARGQFIVIFDADHCPQVDFLERLLGYFRDPQVCFVQTPQDYYNLNSFQHANGRKARWIWHEQSGFHHVEQTGRDWHDSATLCGCSCILRRSHLDEIGGFPEETVTEDMHTAVRMQKLGYKTVFHDEPLAFGVAPVDLIGFVRQRLRWGEGNMQVCRVEGLPFSRQLTLFQNFGYLLLGIAYLDSWRKLVLYGAPVATLITGVPPIHGNLDAFFFFFIPYLISGVVAYQELNSGFGRILKTETFAMGRMTAGLGATWGLFRKNIRFRVSSKALSGELPLLLISPQILILVVGAFAIVVAAVKELQLFQGWEPSGIPYGILLVLILLTAYHCYLAASLIFSALRSGVRREGVYHHHVKLPVRVLTTHGCVTFWTDLISIESATLLPEPGPALAIGSEVQAEIYLPLERLSLKCNVDAAADGGLVLKFQWPNLAGRDRLDQCLHASRWHRVVMGKYEMVLSPFERLGLALAPATRRPEATSVWTPVLVRAENQQLSLAYLREPEGPNRELELLCFGGILQERAEIVAAEDPRMIGKTIQIMGLYQAPLLDSGALETVEGHRFSVVLVAQSGVMSDHSIEAIPAAE